VKFAVEENKKEHTLELNKDDISTRNVTSDMNGVNSRNMDLYSQTLQEFEQSSDIRPHQTMIFSEFKDS